MHVVVSKYNEDTTWTNNVKHRVFVYTKTDDSSEYNVPLNKGNEASAYIKHIIDHYSRLPKHVAFVHGHETDWHHPTSMTDKLNSIVPPKTGYKNLNDMMFKITIEIENDKIIKTPNMDDWYKTCLYPTLGPINQYELKDIDHCCAQFIVSRERILQHTKTFYEKQYDWLLATELPNSESGRFYEWTWRLIFCFEDLKK